MADSRESQISLMRSSKQSAKICSFKVIVCDPMPDSYTYDYNGKNRETKLWRCILVSCDDHSVYCLGEYKLKAGKQADFERHQRDYVHGTTVVPKAVSLVDDAKSQYNSCSVRVTVNMASTTLSWCIENHSAVQPVPKTMISDTKQLQQNQNFDVTVFVLSRDKERKVGETRKAFDLELADGSTDAVSAKVQTMSVTLFGAEAEWIKLRELDDKAIGDQVLVLFRGLKGAKVPGEDAFTFSSAYRGFSMAVAKSQKADDMRAKASALYSLEEKAVVPQKQWFPNESYASHTGTLSTLKNIRDMATPGTGIEELDSQNTFWQLNWVQVVEPAPGTTLRNKDESRLWFPVTLRDFCGSFSMYMAESAALKLSKQPDADSFEAAHKEGRLCFPIVSSVKIIRKTTESTSVNFLIVDGEEQRYDAAPTASTYELVKLLPRESPNGSVEQLADTFVAAMFADIRSSTFYPLSVRYDQQPLPPTMEASVADVKKGKTVCNCTSILALVSSTKPSQKQTMNEKGMTVTTQGVKDLLATDGREYTLTAHCTIDTHMDFMLSPPKRAPRQAALVVICGVPEEGDTGTRAAQPVQNFLVESVLHLAEDDTEHAKASMLRLMSLTALAGHYGGVQRENSGWSELESPCKIRKCRELTRYPTGDTLPAYSKQE